MRSDLLGFIAFLLCGIFTFYGGVFLYSLLYYRLLKKEGWIGSICISLFWMLMYAMFSTGIADFSVVGMRSHKILQIGIEIFIVLLPYIGVIHLLLKYRKANQPPSATPLEPSL